MDFFLLLFNGFAFDLILFLVDFKLGLWRVFQWGLFWFWVGFRMGFPMGLGWFWVVLVWFCVGLSTFEMSCTVGSWVVVVVVVLVWWWDGGGWCWIFFSFSSSWWGWSFSASSCSRWREYGERESDKGERKKKVE